MARLQSIAKRLPLLLPLMLIAATNAQEKDYTCYPRNDYSSDPRCPTVGNDVCDDPNLGGSGGEGCRNQDCIDCNFHCAAFDADCFGCLNAVGCYYCPEEGTCQNSNLYKFDNKDSICTEQNHFWKGGRDDPDVCIGPKSPTLDPLAAVNEWAFEMIRVNEVWPTYTGTGVVIRINDDGVDVDNLDFTDRFSLEGSCSSYLPIDEPGNDHGTKVAGILAGNRDNKHCAVGIAYGSTFSSCNVFERGINFAIENQLNEKLDTFDISQNSIGLPGCPFTRREPQSADCPFNVEQGPCAVCDFTNVDKECEDEITDYCKYNFRRDEANCVDFLEYIIQGPCNYDKLPPSAITGLQEGVTQGRDGKGIIYVFASGNCWWQGEDINMSRWTNSRYTITVGAVGKDGLHTDYSTPGAALTVTGPVGDYRDVSQLMTTDIGGGCTNSGTGTSFSAPVVSGVIALMLEANPNLGWRDVQGILAVTSTNVADLSDRTATTNAAGFWHSNYYGFGIIDAKRGVDTALEWQNWTPEYQAIGESEEENAAIPNDGAEYVSTLTVSNDYRGFSCESVSILLNLQHYNRGDLELRLVAPTGTESILHPGKRDEGELLQGDERWKLSTLKNWGEDPSGVWTLKIRDLVTDNTDLTEENVLRQWKLVAYGRTEDGLPPTLTGNTNAPTDAPVPLCEDAPNSAKFDYVNKKNQTRKSCSFIEEFLEGETKILKNKICNLDAKPPARGKGITKATKIRFVCPRTCGICPDQCKDSNRKYILEGKQRKCSFLDRRRPAVQKALCNTNVGLIGGNPRKPKLRSLCQARCAKVGIGRCAIPTEEDIAV